MGIEFTAAERSRIGLEWEIACVDRRSGELAPAAPEILAKTGPAEGFPHVTGELLTNTVELVTAPHHVVTHAVDELSRLVHTVIDIAEPLGVELISSGTHPFSQWFAQQVTPGNPRYEVLIDRTQWWGRQMMIWGVHIHVGIEKRAKVLPIVNGLLNYLPHFQALSASSPFWAGEITGYASNRALMFQQLPTAGLTPQFSDWESYEKLVADLLHIGVIEGCGDLRWDIRPSPKWGTVELRVFDGISTAYEIGAIAALTQALVEHFSRELDAGREIPVFPAWFHRENKWRAARYGIESIVVVSPAGDERLVTEDLLELIGTLSPIAEELGSLEELHRLTTIIDRGPSYLRQLRVAEASFGSLKAVVGALAAELRDNTLTTLR
ncbi:glutamate--cysteine ligase [Mycobacterium sp. DL592]|uniref:glutamate--cysteine ligase n=1 Tax=Mycobacterium sp. DL592 TaxID=2675524 RepID=UPI00141F8BB9|nr:glutamate--cysteine ligase [Mycobacterium sp. DL592]